MDEFRALLDRFWIRREEDRELFYAGSCFCWRTRTTASAFCSRN